MFLEIWFKKNILLTCNFCTDLGLDELILKCIEFEYFDWIQLAQVAFQCEEGSYGCHLPYTLVC